MKFPEAVARMYNRVWICKRCKNKVKGDALKIMAKKILCKGCGQKDFRPKRKEKKTIK